MRKSWLLFFLLLSANSVRAQLNNWDDTPLPALKKKLAGSNNDVNKVQLQIAIGRAILFKPGGANKEIDSARNFAAQALNLSRRINYNGGIVNAMLLSALTLNQKHNDGAGFRLTQQALAYAVKVKDSLGMAESYIIIGQHYNVYRKAGLPQRISYYNKAIVIFRKMQNMRRLASILQDNAELLFLAHRKTEALKLLFEALSIDKAIGYKRVHGIYWLIGRTSVESGDFPSAVKYSLLAIKTAKEVGDTTLQLCSIYNTLAIAYYAKQDYEQAIPYSLQALQIARRYKDENYIATVAITLSIEYTRTNKLSKALMLTDEVSKFFTNDADRLTIMGYRLANLIYANQFKTAAKYAKEIESLLKTAPPEDFTLTDSYNFLSQYYLGTKQIKEAYFYADRFAEVVKRNNNTPGIRRVEKIYYQLDSIKGDFKSAMRHYLRAQNIKDSIDNITKAYQISLLQIENETEQKDNDIDALTKQALVKDNQLAWNKAVQKLIIAGFIVLSVITLLIFSRYRLKKRSNALVLQQKSEIDEQNIELGNLLNDKDQLLIEKDLLLKEVNHRVKNNLQIVMSLLDSQSGVTQNKKAQEAILESQNRVKSIALIHDQLFHTDKIAEIDLSSYVTELVRSLDYSINKGNHKVSITCNVDHIMLDISQAIPVGIILNESVTNALKYAFPDDRNGEIIVIVKQVEQHIEIQISDNGAGLRPEFNLLKASSLGITLIKGLSAQLKGVFTIDNNRGVTVQVRFPVYKDHVRAASVLATISA